MFVFCSSCFTIVSQRDSGLAYRPPLRRCCRSAAEACHCVRRDRGCPVSTEKTQPPDRDTPSKNPRQAQRRRQRLLRHQALATGRSFNPLEWEESSDGLRSPRPPKPKSPIEDQSTPRKWTIGGLTYFHRWSKAHLPVIEAIPLTAESISRAFVSGKRHPTLPPETHYPAPSIATTARSSPNSSSTIP